MDFSKEMARHLPANADEWLRLIGMQQRHSHGADIVGGFSLFGAGLLVGAGLAMLFAPTSGRALREQLSGGADTLKERVSGSVEHVADAAANSAEKHAR